MTPLAPADLIGADWPDERATIDRAATALRDACAGSDHNRIRDLVEALNEASRPFAQRIMDASIKVALESKSAYEIAR